MDSIKNHFKDILPLKGHRHLPLSLSLYPPNQTLTLFSTLHTGGPSSKPHPFLHTAPPAITSSLLHLHARLSAGINGPSPTGIGFGRRRCLHKHKSVDNWPHPPHFLPSVAASSFLPPFLTAIFFALFIAFVVPLGRPPLFLGLGAGGST